MFYYLFRRASVKWYVSKCISYREVNTPKMREVEPFQINQPLDMLGNPELQLGITSWAKYWWVLAQMG